MAAEAVLEHRDARGWLARPLHQVRRTMVGLSRRVDLRALLVASLLPDILDKPIGLFLFSSAFGTGRLFGHTIWLSAALLLAGFILRQTRAGKVLLVLGFGSSMHLLLDSMWLSPVVLFWPLLGPFPRGSGPDQWLMTIVQALASNPRAYVPEIAGAILLAPLVGAIIGRTSLLRFLRTGTVT